jgi:hypothetical protein
VANTFRYQIIKFIAFASICLLLMGACGSALSAGQSSSAPAVDPQAAFSPLVFEVSYYKLVNPDLAQLTDAEARTNWLNHGVAEGRRAHPLFWTRQYLAFYSDLRAAFGATNFPAALEHYVSNGHSEGRAGVLALTPNVFNVKFYKEVNKDLASLSDTDAEINWIEHGIAENLHAHPRFFALDYLFLNHDKTLLFGPRNSIAAIDDYALAGFDQGRIGILSLASQVFDPVYYTSRHPEQHFASIDAAITFWLQTGLPKGEKGSNIFSPSEYLEQYPDLTKAFGSTGFVDALRHYMQFGRSEGRKGLFAIDQSYLAKIPTSAGVATSQADRVETFTSVTGQSISVTIKAPAPASNAVYTMRPINPGELPDNYFPLAVANAAAAGAATLKIPKGVYDFQGTSTNAHWTINNLTDMTIDGQGSTLNFSKPEFGINMNGITRVVFKNFILDWPKLKIATLGTIIPGPNGQNQLQIESDFPDNGSKFIEALTPWDEIHNTWGRQTSTEAFFDASSAPTFEGNQIYSSPALSVFTPGMVLLVRYFSGEGSAMGIGGAQDLALENVTVHSAPGGAFFFAGSGRVRISNCTLDRSGGKLISSASDAVHFNDSPGDVLVENSRFAFQGDDGMNLASATLMPVQAVKQKTLKLARTDFTPQAGDPVAIFNSALGLLGFSTIDTISQDANGNFDVQLSEAVSHSATDSLVGDLNIMGARWIVRNNQFLDNRARAILPQTPHGLLEGNTMRGQTLASILIATLNDAPPAATTGVQDLQVRRNQISDSGPLAGNANVPLPSHGFSPGAVMVASFLTNGLYDESGSTDVPVNQQIVLSENSVEHVPGPAFFIGSASDVTLSHNKIVDANNGPTYFLGTANTSGSIVVSQAHDVAITDTEMLGSKTGPVSADRHSSSGIKIEQSGQ